MSPLRRRLSCFADLVLFLIVAGLRRPVAALRLHWVHHTLVISVLKRSGLFDRDFYLFQNDDVANSTIPPLRHYVQFGDFEGRWPMPLFDPAYYAEHAGLDSKRRVNRLLHYLYVGRYKGISPSPWFDLKFYLSRNKDVARSGIDPLLHFLRWGGVEGRAPSPRFDSAYYLSANPEVQDWKINPLIHYLRQGQYEGRHPLPSPQSGNYVLAAPRPVMPWSDGWIGLAPAVQADAQVDVIVPIYGGAAVTLRCLHSVLSAKQTTRYELIVINDASPDQELVSSVQDLADRGLFRLVHNAENQGFVKSANIGMRANSGRDVVLLNSDTEVFGDWLDRLRQAAQREHKVGTVTPLSNNATICSYPIFVQDNPYPLEIGYDELDALTRSVNSGQAVVAPTGVGFCIYLKRECLDDVGMFDEDAFGRGYGEENDLCQRAIQRGWRNLIACDVFVRHWGAESFQGERASRVKAALEIVNGRHPKYLADVKRFIGVDPLARARARLDLARLARRKRTENVLLVAHARGGGTERHIFEDIARLKVTGKGVFLMRPEPDGQHVAINHPEVTVLPNLKRPTLGDHAYLVELLTELAITEVHIHHLIDFSHGAGNDIKHLAATLNVPYRVMIHDYTPICPRVNLVDTGGVYCGEPPETHCNACIARNGTEFGKVRIEEWRAQYRSLLSGARAVVVPDADVAQRLSRYFLEVHIEVQPHEDPELFLDETRHEPLDADASLRIAIIGAISKIKGYEVLLACARDARKRMLPLEFVVYGYSQNDLMLRREGVTVTGRYLDAYADEGLAKIAPHCVWLPYVWPETYSYTLSIALKHGRPIFAFDLGAIGARLRRIGSTRHLLSLTLACNPCEINNRFMAYRDFLVEGGMGDTGDRVPPEPRNEPATEALAAGFRASLRVDKPLTLATVVDAGQSDPNQTVPPPLAPVIHGSASRH